MAWWCSAHTNDELVDKAYSDSPQPIGHGVTISAPHMHAIVLQLMESRIVGQKVPVKILDVGSGSGCLTAYLGKLLQLDGDGSSVGCGKVYGVDHIEDLVSWSRNNVLNDSPELIEKGIVTFLSGDGRQGLSEAAPFDLIHVGAASPELPQPLVDQLSPGGRLVIPIGTKWGEQSLEVIDKINGSTIIRKKAMPVKFVPLTDKSIQIGTT